MKYRSSEFIETENIDWEQVDDGVKRKILGYDDNIMMVKIHFEKDAIGKLHKHRHSQSTYIESGKFEVNVEGDKKILKQGDGFYIPPNYEHGVVCLEEGVLIDVFSPIREDFMEG